MRAVRLRDPSDRELQRMRILHALAEIACEEGLEAVTVTRICSLAGASRRAFHGLFADRDDALAQAFEETVARARARVRAAAADLASGDERRRATLLALLAFLEEEPELAGMFMTHLATGDSPVPTRTDSLIRELLAVLEPQLAGACVGAAPARTIATTAVREVVEIGEAHRLSHLAAPLRAMLGELSSVVALGSCGPEQERRVALVSGA